jgi:hypothetical protein
MREVIISTRVRNKISELELFLKDELKLSKQAALSRCNRIDDFLLKLGNPADYPLCRFKRWQALGYRCVVFEKTWIFAYEVVSEGIIVRDMSHTSMLIE